MRKIFCIRLAIRGTLMLTLINVFVFSALAANFYVDPTGSDSNSCLGPGSAGACKTIQAAINKSGTNDFINVAAGTYPEAVSVYDRNGLTVSGVGPTTIIVPPVGPLAPSQPLVTIDTSRRISFQNMRVSGGGADTEGFRIFYSTAVTISSCNVDGHNGAGGGFFINGTIGAIINAAIVEDNGLGIRVDGNSEVALSSPPFATANSIVRHNGTGVQVRSGDFAFQGSGIIESNDTGIMVDGGSVKACCEDQTSPRKINSNGVGMLIRTGSTVELRGPLEFVGNQVFAIRQFGSGVTISGSVTFQTNGTSGSSAINQTGGQLTLNGGPSPNQIVIKNNPGTGILLTDGASLRMSNVTVTNNGVNGVRVQALSTAALIQNIVMNNNSGRDLSCTPNAFARGDNSAVNTQFCPGFDNSPDPNGH
jgi:hypothetical protein